MPTNNTRKVVIQRIVKSVLDHEHSDLDVGEFKKLFDKSSSKICRLVWLCIVLICSGICITQIADRMQWFLSHPVAVDLTVRNVDVVDMFRVKIYSAENEYVDWMLRNRVTKQVFGVEKPFIHALFLRYNDTDILKLWSYENGSNIIESVWNEVSSEKLPCSSHHDVSFLGQSNEIDLSKADLVNGIRLELRPKLTNSVLDANLAHVNEISSFTMGDILYDKGNYVWTMRLRRYHHLSVPNKPCVDEHVLKKCYINCIINQLKSTTKCRLPFHQKKLDLPVCNNIDDAKASYQKTAELYMQPDTYGKCNCIRSCIKLTFTTLRDTKFNYNYYTMLTVIVDKTEVSMTERRAYDEISLLTDIGGNLGLFIGLSLLSSINLIQQIVVTISKRIWPKRKMNSHSQYQQIKSYVLLHCCRNSSSTTKNTTRAQNSRLGVHIMCCIIATFMIQDRIRYYFYYPVRLIIEVESKLNVTLPSITICGVSDQLRFLKRQYAKENNLSDWCKVDLSDLLHVKEKFTLENLWKMTLESPITAAEDVIQNTINLTMTKPAKKTMRTHLGDCTLYKFESTTFLGYVTLFPIIYAWSKSKECPNLANKIFTDDIGSESYNILTASIAPLNVLSIYDFSITKVTRLNSPINPCISKEAFKECKEQCLSKQISDLHVCSLPFLTDKSGNTTLCNSTSAIKESLHNYTVTLLKITNGVSCFCSRLCNENVVSHVNSVLGNAENLVYSISIAMTSNTFENIIELENYKLVSLFCDVGNSLGIALGISILSLVSFMQESVMLYKFFAPNAETVKKLLWHIHTQ